MNKKQINQFVAFLASAGAEILSLTNPWEVLRFRANCEIGIVYQNKHGNLTFIGQAEEAYEAYRNKKSWSACKKLPRIRKNIVVTTLLNRDGFSCFYCGLHLEDGKETVEHLFSINQGGKNHIANLALAHFECNKEASHLSVVEKVKLRESKMLKAREAE